MDEALSTTLMKLLIGVTLAAARIFGHKALSRSTEANRGAGLSQVQAVKYETMQEIKCDMTARHQSYPGL